MIEIITNNQPREVIYGDQLPPNEYNWWKDLLKNIDEHSFVMYKGSAYPLSDMMLITEGSPLATAKRGPWEAYISDSFFSGVVIKFNEFQEPILGTFYAKSE